MAAYLRGKRDAVYPVSQINLFFTNRLQNIGNENQKRLLRKYYRGAHILHACMLRVCQFQLPVYIACAEAIIISTVFLVIRLHQVSGWLVTLFCLFDGILCFFAFKATLQFSARVRDSSIEFARLPYVKRARDRLSKSDKLFLASCKPLELRVSSTFTVTRESFPTISQYIILASIINLLVIFK